MSFIAKILGNVGIDKLVDSIGNNVDRFVTTKEEKLELKRAIEKDVQNFQIEYLKDVQSARDMYREDSSLQKVYAIVFLIAYMILTAGMIALVWFMVKDQVSFPEWAITFISAIWGAMSAKVSTITDFLFGSSQGSRDKDNIKMLNK